MQNQMVTRDGAPIVPRRPTPIARPHARRLPAVQNRTTR